MSIRIKWIALAVSAIIIFTIGVMWGNHMARPNQEMLFDGSSASGNTTSTATRAENFDQASNKRRAHLIHQPLTANPAQQQILHNLHEALLLPKESRTAPLLKALEETTKLPLTKDLLDNMRSIVDEGEIESSHYLLSLMEQREEKASVELLLHAASHQNPDVADRALFALEAVAGTVFKNREEAATWAAAWKPDPARAELFSPVQEQAEESSNTSDSRNPGPRSIAPKNLEHKPE